MTESNSFDRFGKTFDIEDPAFAEQFEVVCVKGVRYERTPSTSRGRDWGDLEVAG